jgi:hypothetical protein
VLLRGIALTCPSTSLDFKKSLKRSANHAKFHPYTLPDAATLASTREYVFIEFNLQVRGRNLFFSTDTEAGISNADIIFVSVNTPTKTYGIGEGSAADVRNVELAARLIGSIAKTPKIVVEKSTVPVKTGETIARVLNATGSTSLHFCPLCR